MAVPQGSRLQQAHISLFRRKLSTRGGGKIVVVLISMTAPDLRPTALALILVLGLAAETTAHEAVGGDSMAANSEPATVPVGQIAAGLEVLTTRLEEFQAQRPISELEWIEAQLTEMGLPTPPRPGRRSRR